VFLLLSLWGCIPLSAETVRVGYYENAPKLFTGETGEAEGFFPELLREVATIEGWALEFVPGTWEAGLAALQAGTIDLLPDVAYSPERADVLTFNHEVVTHNWSDAFVRPGLVLDSALDLDGLRVAVVAGSIQRTYLEETLPTLGVTPQLIEYATFAETVDAVLAEEADAAIVNRLYPLANRPIRRLEPSGLILNPVPLHIAAPAGDPRGLLQAIDRWLATEKAEPSGGRLSELESAWFQEASPGAPSWWLPAWIMTGFLLLLTFGCLIFISIRLKSRNADMVALNDALRRKVDALRETESRLVAETRKAREANQAKDAFLAMVSHELRTPLNPILALSEIGLLDEDQDPETRESLQLIQNSGNQMLDLVDNLLTLTALTARRVELNLSWSHADRMAGRLKDAFGDQIGRRGLELSFTFEEREQPWFATDCELMQQAVREIVENAIRHTREGAIRFELTLTPLDEPPPGAPDLFRADNLSEGQSLGRLDLSIHDTGEGIPSDRLEAIFEPFSLAENINTRRGDGSGLGLTLCRQIVLNLGGEVSASSIPGRGSVFVIQIPVLLASEAPAEAVVHAGRTEPGRGDEQQG
jgi:signal transduction histidine kinase